MTALVVRRMWVDPEGAEIPAGEAHISRYASSGGFRDVPDLQAQLRATLGPSGGAPRTISVEDTERGVRRVERSELVVCSYGYPQTVIYTELHDEAQK